jgi:hypothetical protein
MRKMTQPIPNFHNAINALGGLRGGVKVVRDFAHDPIGDTV